MKNAAVQWLEPRQEEIPPALLEAAGNVPLLAHALLSRGIADPAQALVFLDPAQYTPADPLDLPDLDAAAGLLAVAIQHQQVIGIWGDFDVDGQTSTTLLYQSLSELGARVVYHIPVRGVESHGVGLEALKAFLAEGVQMVLTCDTGITAHQAVEYARSQGIPFVITDHHTLPASLPPAEAVVNPQRLPSGHPLAYLCGVGVAYCLAAELYRRLGKPGCEKQYLDLVALGTVADLALLKGDNRYLTYLGLEAIRRGPRPALQALFKLTETDPSRVDEEHIAFGIAPRLNALGRLADANLAVAFFGARSVEEATPFALELEKLNGQRRLLSDQVFKAAQSQLQRDPALLNEAVLVLGHPTWPGGVVGIVASRLVDLYHKPVALLSAPPGEPARGSARSIEGINITAALTAVQDHLLNFGGHPMAAGFSIPPDSLPQFRAALNVAVQQQALQAPTAEELEIDAFLPLDAIDLDLVQALERMAPFGPGNPPIVLACRALSLKSHSAIGKTKEHLQLLVEDAAGVTRRVLWWQGAGMPLPEGHFDLAFSARPSDFRGERRVQVEWIHARPIPEDEPIRLRRPAVRTLDFRQAEDPQAALLQFVHAESALVWAEGDSAPPTACSNRLQLVPAPALALWCLPPGLEELRAILDRVQPGLVAFFGIRSSRDLPQELLTRVGGMARYALRTSQGRLELASAAAALCQRLAAVRLALEWWVAHGDLTPLAWDESSIQLAPGGSPDPAALAKIESELKSLLQETAAFRSYYLRALPEQLLE